MDPESIDTIDASGWHLLPDLYHQEQSLDSLEGGQLIIEKKTR